jgi:hypothetical protein
MIWVSEELSQEDVHNWAPAQHERQTSLLENKNQPAIFSSIYDIFFEILLLVNTSRFTTRLLLYILVPYLLFFFRSNFWVGKDMDDH